MEIPASASPTSPLAVWARPRSPLPPHRLAKLANALGVSTPMPATQPSPTLMPNSASTQPHHFLRSPSPAAPSSIPYSQSISRFLFHVIPPLHLPHETDSSDSSDLTPPPSNASGYHTQFRRGTLVPMHATLQSQLSAIAKEYALPSTAGMILYLILSNQTPSLDGSDLEEPGPRLSEDIWKHLWSRVIQVERDEHIEIASRSHTPHMYGLGIRLTAQSSPNLPQDSESLSPTPMSYPFTPSPSTPSSPSENRSNSTPSQPQTPESSERQADTLDLPGLHASSIIPILAKVEFDIDRRKAGWYEPWLRSRRMNHAKRAESQMSRRRAQSRAGDDGSVTGESETVASTEEKRAPLDLKLLGGVQTASPAPSFALSVKDDLSEDEVLLEGYHPISESPDSQSDADQEITARLTGKEPLDDVFGTDEDTWADLHDRRNSHREKNPYVVDLALNASDLAVLPDDHEYDDSVIMTEENEVNELLAAMSRPLLSVSIPSSPAVAKNKRGSSPTTAGSSRKQAPPPLFIHGLPNNLPQPGSAESGDPPSPVLPTDPESSHLAYLRSANSAVDDSYDTVAEEAAFQRTRSPLDDRRGGAVFEDLDLGLEDSEANVEFDENDPHDHRRSQYLMKAQLDELEKHLAEFSPRRLKTDLDDDDASSQRTHYSPGFPTLSPHNGTKNTDVFPLTPGFTTGFPSPDKPDTDFVVPPHATSAAWPAIPFSALAANEVASTSNAVRPNGRPPSSPRLVNDGPKPLQDGRSSTDSVSKETALRKRDLEEQGAAYPPLMPPLRLRDTSPIIPLSPDPFGRYPSLVDATASGSSRQSSVYWEVPPGRSSPAQENQAQRGGTPMSVLPEEPRHSVGASRFSVDSEVSADAVVKPANRSTLITVKSIKKLWRRSKSSSISVPPLAPPPAASSTAGLAPAIRSPRPSEEFDAPKPLKSTRPPSPLTGNWPPKPRTESSLSNLHFDQESPYPVRRPSHSSPRPPAAPLPSTSAPPPASAPLAIPPAKAVSAPSTPSLPASTPPAGPSSMPPSALPTEKERSAPKSILRKSLVRPQSSSPSDARPSGGPREFARLRRAAGRLSASASPDIPPSPPIPEQFVNAREDARHSVRAGARWTPTDHASPQARPGRLPPVFPPRRSSSLASSRASEEGQPSFDTSQFEMVSTKAGATLAYPYHGLDHD